jgi:thiosulfate/3-mercaptopyruvate sulfurtransferase
MMAYTLARFGVEKLYILDGGLDAWVAERRATSRELPTVRPSRFRARVRDGQVVTMREVRKMKDRSDVVLLDARPPESYAGKGRWGRPGHIPGAVNLYWKKLVRKDNPLKLRNADQLRKIFKAHGATPDKTIICSCSTGREATQQYVILTQVLKYPDVRIYEGSFAEWVTDPNNPTKTGSAP